MKKVQIFLLSIMILTACVNGKSSVSADDNDDSTDSAKVEVLQEQVSTYDATDALGFGLKGMVKNVEYQIYSTYEVDGKINQGSLYERGDIAFDKYGHILVDEWLNEYGYDAEGNFYRGTHLYTKIQRDKDGRLSKYADVDPTGKSEVYNTYVFKYDKSGRITSVALKGWTEEWTEIRKYKGANIFPESSTKTGTYEGGGGYSTFKKYLYQHTDTYGNWTERTIISNTKDMSGRHSAQSDTIMPDSVLPSYVAPSRNQSPQVNDEIQIEKRVITYYD